MGAELVPDGNGDYVAVSVPNLDEYVSFQLVGGPHDSDWVRIHQDAPVYECLDDDGWIVRYERHTYRYGGGNNRTVFIYTGLPRKE